MKSEFRILWFEDNQQWREMMSQRISDYLERHCLGLAVEFGEIDDHELIDRLSNNSYELVLMDFRLSDDPSQPRGDEVIRRIRGKEVKTDVLFYSSDFNGMIEKAVVPPILDGVYFSKRKDEEFTPKLFSVIDKIVAQSENIVNLRGFVLDSCSHYETEFKLQIQKRISRLSGESRNSFKEHLRELVDDSIEKKQKKWEAAEKKDAEIITKTNECDPAVIYEQSEKELLIDMQMRTQLLQYCYCKDLLREEYSAEDEERIARLCKYYQDEINIYRNRLAHVEEGQETIKIKGKNIPVNRELHEQLRSSISEFDTMWNQFFL